MPVGWKAFYLLYWWPLFNCKISLNTLDIRKLELFHLYCHSEIRTTLICGCRLYFPKNKNIWLLFSLHFQVSKSRKKDTLFTWPMNDKIKMIESIFSNRLECVATVCDLLSSALDWMWSTHCRDQHQLYNHILALNAISLNRNFKLQVIVADTTLCLSFIQMYVICKHSLSEV